MQARHALLVAAMLGASCGDAKSRGQVEWRSLQPGLAYASISLPVQAPLGESRLHVLRIDPKMAELRAAMASAHGGRRRTARVWCERAGLSAAINLGMYQDDYRSNVGYARAAGHVNNGRWAARYKSLLLFHPKRADLPPAALLDLDDPTVRSRANDYRGAIQNLRLIRAPGKNVWTKQAKRWSEAAVAMDGEGRLLFLFCRAPYSMWEFNEILLSLPLGIRSAMHVEGGPEASLSIHTPALHLDLNGSYETGFRGDDSEPDQWPIPNVLGVAAKPR